MQMMWVILLRSIESSSIQSLAAKESESSSLHKRYWKLLSERLEKQEVQLPDAKTGAFRFTTVNQLLMHYLDTRYETVASASTSSLAVSMKEVQSECSALRSRCMHFALGFALGSWLFSSCAESLPIQLPTPKPTSPPSARPKSTE